MKPLHYISDMLGHLWCKLTERVFIFVLFWEIAYSTILCGATIIFINEYLLLSIRSKYRVQREKMRALAFRFGLRALFDRNSVSNVFNSMQNKLTSKYLH